MYLNKPNDLNIYIEESAFILHILIVLQFATVQT